VRTWDKAIKIDTVSDPALASNQARYHGVNLGLTPGGLIFWLISSGRDMSLDRDLNGNGIGAAGDAGANYTLGTRSGADRAFDKDAVLWRYHAATRPRPQPGSANTTGYYAGQEIPAPAGTARDGNGRRCSRKSRSMATRTRIPARSSFGTRLRKNFTLFRRMPTRS
jgi:hypothetical protein